MYLIFKREENIINNSPKVTIFGLHGLGGSANSITGLLQYLDPKQFEIIPIALPGSRFEKYHHEKTLDDFADFVVDKMKSYHKKNFYLLGFSFGGLIAHLISENYHKYFTDELRGAIIWAAPFLGLTPFLNLFYSSLNLTADILNKPGNLEKVMKTANALKIGLNRGDTEDLILTDKKSLARGMKIIKSTKYSFHSDLRRNYIFDEKDIFVKSKTYDYVQKHLQSKNSKAILLKSGGHFSSAEAFHRVNKLIADFCR